MSKKMKSIVAVLAVALTISIGFNLGYIFVNGPQTQRTINIMRTQALKGWLGEMYRVDSLLKGAKTNDDVDQVYNYVRGEATYFAEAVSADYSEPMYTSIGATTFYLGEGLLAMYFGKSLGAIWQRSLNQTELSMIANLTDNLDGLQQTRLEYWLDYSYNFTGMDPVQELAKVGVNITVVLGYLNQMTQVSQRMISYYQ